MVPDEMRLGQSSLTTQASFVSDPDPLLPYRAKDWLRTYGGALNSRGLLGPKEYLELTKSLPGSPRVLIASGERQWAARSAVIDALSHRHPSSRRAKWHAVHPPEERASRAIQDLAIHSGSFSARAHVHIHPAERNAAALYDPSTRLEQQAVLSLPPLVPVSPSPQGAG